LSDEVSDSEDVKKAKEKGGRGKSDIMFHFNAHGHPILPPDDKYELAYLKAVIRAYVTTVYSKDHVLYEFSGVSSLIIGIFTNNPK
jgi:hypothetical protein